MPKKSTSRRPARKSARPPAKKKVAVRRKGTVKTTATPGKKVIRRPRRPLRPPAAGLRSAEERLQKVLAAAGYGSRRQCEELITAGRVEVDRQVVDTLGVRVDPMKQTIRVDGQAIPRKKLTYIALFKPKGVLCTHRDQKGRRRAIDLVPAQFGRLFTVGRLDMDSEGLLLLTNDGDLAERLTHPRYGVQKTYRVQVSGVVENETLHKLKQGVYLADGFAKVAHVVVKRVIKQSTVLDIVLEEGMNREIRRVLARLGHKVMTLMRVSIGPLKLGKMLPGDYRQLNAKEVAALYAGK